MPTFVTRIQPPPLICRQLITDFVQPWVKKQRPFQITFNSSQTAFKRCLHPFSPISLESIYLQFYPAENIRASPIQLCWGTWSWSPPPCCCLLVNKGTEVNGLETHHVGLAEVTAAGRPNVVGSYFIRQVPMLSFLMKEVHLWLGWGWWRVPVADLIPPTSDMQYPAREWTLPS